MERTTTGFFFFSISKSNSHIVSPVHDWCHFPELETQLNSSMTLGNNLLKNWRDMSVLWEDSKLFNKVLDRRQASHTRCPWGYYYYVELSCILQASVLQRSPLLTKMLHHHENRSESGEQAPSWRKQLGGGGAEVAPTLRHNL